MTQRRSRKERRRRRLEAGRETWGDYILRMKAIGVVELLRRDVEWMREYVAREYGEKP